MVTAAATLLLLTLLDSVPLVSAAEAGRDAAIRDLRGIFATSGLPPFAVPCALLFSFALLMWLRRRGSIKHSPLLQGEQATNSHHEMLVVLMEEWRLQQIDMSEVIERLTLIVHGFLHDRTGLAGHHLTSEEILAALSVTGEKDFLNRAEAMLLFCDKVRFGGMVPTAGQTEGALIEALRLIQDHSGTLI